MIAKNIAVAGRKGDIIHPAVRARFNLPIYPIRPNLDIESGGLVMAGKDLEPIFPAPYEQLAIKIIQTI